MTNNRYRKKKEESESASEDENEAEEDKSHSASESQREPGTTPQNQNMMDESSEMQESYVDEDDDCNIEVEKSSDQIIPNNKVKPLNRKKLMQGPEIFLLDLNSKPLQCVYNGEEEELQYELNKYRQINDGGKKFKYA